MRESRWGRPGGQSRSQRSVDGAAVLVSSLLPLCPGDGEHRALEPAPEPFCVSRALGAAGPTEIPGARQIFSSLLARVAPVGLLPNTSQDDL